MLRQKNCDVWISRYGDTAATNTPETQRSEHVTRINYPALVRYEGLKVHESAPVRLRRNHRLGNNSERGL
jgi:hypothetical protein